MTVSAELRCCKCGSPAKYKRAPDLGVPPIGSCEICDDSVAQAYFTLLLDGEKPWKALVRHWFITTGRSWRGKR